MGDQFEAIKQLIISQLESTPMRPTDLLAALGDKYPDSPIKEAILRLLREGCITMAQDRQLHVLHEAA
jgi:hypothetical protein